MAITPDVLGTLQSTWAESITFPATVGTGNFLVVAHMSTAASNSTVTWNGNTVDIINFKYDTVGGARAMLSGLTSPESGTHNIVITPPQSTFIGVIVSSWNNVDSIGNLGEGIVSNGASPLSYTCVTESGQLVVDVVAAYYPTGTSLTKAAAQTLIGESAVADDPTVRIGSSYQTSAGTTTTVSWSWSSGNAYVPGCCMALIPGAPPPPSFIAKPFSSASAAVSSGSDTPTAVGCSG